MDEEKLILEVEKHNILYDTTHPFYKDVKKKDNAWAEIGKVLQMTGDQCKNKWRALRDSYVKSRKKSNLPSGSAAGTPKEWKFEKIMSFLTPYLQPRSSRSSLDSASLMDTEEDQPPTPLSLSGADEAAGPSTQSTPSTVASAAASAQEPSTSRDRSRSPLDRTKTTAANPVGQSRKTSRGGASKGVDFGDKLIELLKEPPQRPYMPEGATDECYHFALSIVPLLSAMEITNRQNAKVGIMQLIQHHQQLDRKQQGLHQQHHPPYQQQQGLRQQQHHQQQGLHQKQHPPYQQQQGLRQPQHHQQQGLHQQHHPPYQQQQGLHQQHHPPYQQQQGLRQQQQPQHQQQGLHQQHHPPYQQQQGLRQQHHHQQQHPPYQQQRPSMQPTTPSQPSTHSSSPTHTAFVPSTSTAGQLGEFMGLLTAEDKPEVDEPQE